MAFKFGHVAVVGQPNVGKSTLINFIVGQKVSIVSSKPQTTRKRVMGIHSTDDYQIAFIDTPGIHTPHNRLQRAMVEQARAALDGIDQVLVVVDGARKPDEIDESIAGNVGHANVPVVLCMNKMDHLKPEHVIRNTESYGKLFGTEDVMLTTAVRGINVDKLIALIVEKLPERSPLYAPDEFTDASERFLSAEFVREQILLKTRQELPHCTAVIVEEWERQPNGTTRITASIVVDKASQRGIMLGKQGQFIKAIGTESRAEIEKMIGGPVFLDLHVRVQEGWRQNPRLLRELDLG